MTHRTLLCSLLALTLTAALAEAQQLTKFRAKPNGGSVKIAGTSTMHDWTVQGNILGGSIELPEEFGSPDARIQPGPLTGKATVNIPVSSLKSGKSLMDSVMHEAMKQEENPRITYKLTELTVTEAPPSSADPIKLASKGELTVAGVTKPVTMPVDLHRLENRQLKFVGTTDVKMTDFGIKPPAPALALGAIKTGDDVKITFEWLTAPVPAAAPASLAPAAP